MYTVKLENNHTEGNLPENWERRSIRSVSQKTFLVDPTKEPDEIFQYVDVSSVSNELWKISESTQIQGSKAPSRARKKIQTNDVIFATVRPTLKRVALVPKELNGQVASTAFCVIRTFPEKAEPRFVFYSLLTDEFAQKMGSIEHGASYPAVTDGNVLDQELFLPPLPEQKAIATVLFKIQNAIEIQDKTISTLKELKAATMVKLYREGLQNEPLKATPIGSIPESWAIVRFSDTCEPPQYGYTETASLSPIGPKFLRITDIQESIVKWETVPYCNCETQKAQKYLLRSGDLVFARIGATAGKSYLVSDPPEAVFASYLIRLRPINVHPVFLNFFCQSDLYWQQVNAIKGENLKGGFSGSILTNFFHCLPKDIQEQERIGEILSTIHNKILFHNEKVANLKRLFSSILPKLLIGELRVNDALEFLEKEISNV